MLANNPMGSRRRRRFYHRAGVVPIPGDRFKGDFNDPNFFKYEPEPMPIEVRNEEIDDGDNQPFSFKIQRRKRRISIVNIGSFLHRLLGIIDSVIALAETEKRVNAKKRSAKQAADTKSNEATDENSPQDADNGVKESFDSKPKMG